MMLSLNSNSSTNWITSFDLGKYNEFSDSFEVDDKIYVSIKGTYDQFWVFKLFFSIEIEILIFWIEIKVFRSYEDNYYFKPNIYFIDR